MHGMWLRLLDFGVVLQSGLKPEWGAFEGERIYKCNLHQRGVVKGLGEDSYSYS